MKKFTLILISLFFLGLPWLGANAADLNSVSLGINPLNASSLATWTISFTIPSDIQLGHILISLGGYQPDLGAAELFVSGIPHGNPQVGKSNPNCVFNCDDIRYYYNDPISVKKGTKITFTLNKVKNHSKVGQTGLNFINVFSSKYPQMVLAFASDEKLVNLTEERSDPLDEDLLPETTTSEGPQTASAISQVLLNELFYQPGAKTTRLNAIADTSKVTDFTLDLLGKEKVTFLGPLDLSKPEAVLFFEKLGNYFTFNKLAIEIKQELMEYFKVPLEITFYDLPYVWDPDVFKNDEIVLAKDKLEDYHFVIYDNKPQITFKVREGGSYQLIPHLELFIADNAQIRSEKNELKISGRISDPSAILQISLNGKELKDLGVKPDSQKGDFNFTVQLLEGPNLIQVQANSEYGEIDRINKIIQFLPPSAAKPEEKGGISPLNIVAIVLAIIAVIFIIAIARIVRKKK